jgi:hypothetical protein
MRWKISWAGSVSDIMSMSFPIKGWAKIARLTLSERRESDMLKSWQRRCFKCEWVVGSGTNWICLKLVEKLDKNIRIIVHTQAEECGDYEKKKKA